MEWTEAFRDPPIVWSPELNRSYPMKQKTEVARNPV
jgi:hypothetical protein